MSGWNSNSDPPERGTCADSEAIILFELPTMILHHLALFQLDQMRSRRIKNKRWFIKDSLPLDLVLN